MSTALILLALVAADPKEKLPVPDAKTQAAARKKVLLDFRGERLAASNLVNASNDYRDPAMKYIAINLALDIRLSAGQYSGADGCVRRLTRLFAVDELALSYRFHLGISRNCKDRRDQRKNAQESLELFDPMIKAKRFKEAEMLAKSIGAVSVKLRDAELNKKMKELLTRIKTAKRQAKKKGK